MRREASGNGFAMMLRGVYTDITSGGYDGSLDDTGDHMKVRTSKASHGNAPRDVGTLWMMRRSGHLVRCALLAWPVEWELRVVVDGEILLAERCPRGAEAFRLSERWRDRMLEQGWQQVVPGAPRGRPSASASVT
jgi:hypothetical protein